MADTIAKVIGLDEIESIYNIEVNKRFTDRLHIAPDELLDFAVELKNKYSIKERYNKNEISTDMLLFEYDPSSLSITRQVCIENNEPHENDYNIYQLSMTLSYDKSKFISIFSFCEWSNDYNTLDEFITSMKEKEEFLLAKALVPTSLEIFLDEC